MIGMLSGKGHDIIRRIYAIDGCSPTVVAHSGGGTEPKIIQRDMKTYKIRKMTPKECFRLMGVSDADIEKMQSVGISDSQLYKMAGNSIVVDVMEGIFTRMFKEQ